MVNHEVYKELNNIIREGLKDPRVALMTSIVSLEVAPDLKTCKAYVSVLMRPNLSLRVPATNRPAVLNRQRIETNSVAVDVLAVVRSKARPFAPEMIIISTGYNGSLVEVPAENFILFHGYDPTDPMRQ